MGASSTSEYKGFRNELGALPFFKKVKLLISLCDCFALRADNFFIASLSPSRSRFRFCKLSLKISLTPHAQNAKAEPRRLPCLSWTIS